MTPDHPPSPPAPPKTRKILFTGQAEDYFGIWIVNIILSIITIGLYTPWAKVRKIQYFYNNTSILDHPLVFHATGLEIFKARIIAFFVFFIANVVSNILPTFGFIFAVIFFFAIPWMINKKLKFYARKTSWRNVHFDWREDYGKIFSLTYLWPLVAIFTLGLTVPLIYKKYYQLFIDHHSFGQEKFRSHPQTSLFYLSFLNAVILPTIVLLVIGAFILNTPVVQEFLLQVDTKDAIPFVALMGVYIVGILTLFCYGTLCRNIILKSTVLGKTVSFNSTISVGRYVWIFLSNVFVSLLSIGFLRPWAKCRSYRYLCSQTLIKTKGDMEVFLDERKQDVGALGEELADFGDVGFDL